MNLVHPKRWCFMAGHPRKPFTQRRDTASTPWLSGILPRYQGQESTREAIQPHYLSERQQTRSLFPIYERADSGKILNFWASTASTSGVGDLLTTWRQGPDTVDHSTPKGNPWRPPRPPSKMLNCIYDLFSESPSTVASQLTNHSPNKYQKHSMCQAPNRSNQTSHPVSSPEDRTEKGVGRKALGQPQGHSPASAPLLELEEPQCCSHFCQMKILLVFLLFSS